VNLIRKMVLPWGYWETSISEDLDNIFETSYLFSNDVGCTMSFQIYRAFGCIEETEKALYVN